MAHSIRHNNDTCCITTYVCMHVRTKYVWMPQGSSPADPAPSLSKILSARAGLLGYFTTIIACVAICMVHSKLHILRALSKQG